MMVNIIAAKVTNASFIDICLMQSKHFIVLLIAPILGCVPLESLLSTERLPNSCIANSQTKGARRDPDKFSLS